MPFTTRTSHLATAAVAILGTVVAMRVPWTTEASATGANAPNAAQTPQAQAVVYFDQFGRPLQALPAAPARLQPIAYAALPTSVEPEAIVTAPQPAAVRPAVIRSSGGVRTATSPSVVRQAEPRRSWQKQVLVIGGSAGTGAGIGALIGGKKGAAIGAALGGGGAALYTAVKK
jgi:hypothetical protein